MYIRLPDLHDSATPVQPPNLNPLKSLFQERADALSNAATLLAGSKGAALVFAIRDALQRNDHLGRGVKTALQRLLDILSLENVNDLSREEAARFAAIDSSDSVVEEICLLTDELRDALDCADATTALAPRQRVIA
ncbi:hypothetical protein ACSQ76_01090 [Roseovarius sp. B08]|uniref:hypothetical protein n=1 Tax=Roseovarius sp. B08 TaxID=3449223 RepID=UPI003EDBFC07